MVANSTAPTSAFIDRVRDLIDKIFGRPGYGLQDAVPACAGTTTDPLAGYPLRGRDVAWSHQQQEKVSMNKDRVMGSAKVVKGNVKAAVGKTIGDKKLEASGEVDKIEGKTRNAVGVAEEEARDMTK